MATYTPRLVDPWLRELLDDAPGVMVVGPRASGKTTSAMRIAKTVFRLDNDEIRLSIAGDPDAVFSDAEPPVLVDEWQLAPNCLAAAKRLIDTDPQPGSFLFTGSATDTLNNGAWAGTGRTTPPSATPERSACACGRRRRWLSSTGLPRYARPSR